MKVKKILLLLSACLAAAGLAAGFAHHAKQTPEYALEQLVAGISARDYARIKQYVDVKGLVTQAYDDSTRILCREVGRLNEEYPQDWFFYHDTAFMVDYIAARREKDLAFIERALELDLDGEARPRTAADGQPQWVADEAKKFQQDYKAELISVQQQGDKAIASVKITGGDTDYGRLVPELIMKLELQQQESGQWCVMRVANVEEVFDPIVKGIEDYWDLQGWPVREEMRRKK